MPVIKNVKVDWAEVHKENEKYGGWGIELRVTPEVKTQLQALGLQGKIQDKKKDYKQASKPMVTVDPYFKLRLYPTTKAGKRNEPPVVVDAMKNPFIKNVGNGSLCNISMNVYNSSMTDDGKGVQLKAVQVINHVEYGDALEAFDIEVDEFNTDDSTDNKHESDLEEGDTFFDTSEDDIELQIPF